MSRLNETKKETQQRFWLKVKKTDSCWNWTAGLRYSYGIFSIKNKSFVAHRLSWMWTFGKIPKGLIVCHTCDNGKCVNPKHLFLGTQQDNVADRVKKGRTARGDKSGARLYPESYQGEKNSAAKLKESDILKIRKMYFEDTYSKSTLAKMFNIDYSTLRRIAKKETWKHIL